ncbi:MAG: hypothetical protein ACREPA_07960 [Candidatus Dormibacteraceae bacterium]
MPSGWRVTVHCTDRMTRSASCAIARLGDTSPAFPGASSPRPLSGLAPGASVTFSFVAGEAGDYRVLSLVPGDQPAGLWDIFEVTPGGTPAARLRSG